MTVLTQTVDMGISVQEIPTLGNILINLGHLSQTWVFVQPTLERLYPMDEFAYHLPKVGYFYIFFKECRDVRPGDVSHIDFKVCQNQDTTTRRPPATVALRGAPFYGWLLKISSCLGQLSTERDKFPHGGCNISACMTRV